APDAPARCRRSSPASRAPPVSACSYRCRTVRRTCSQSARAPNPASAKSNSAAIATAPEAAPSRLPLAPQPAAPFPSRLPRLFAATLPRPCHAPPARPLPAPPAAAAEPPHELPRLPAFAELHLAMPAPLPASCAPLPLSPLLPPPAPDPLPAGALLLRPHPRALSLRAPVRLSFLLPLSPAHLPRPFVSPPSRALLRQSPRLLWQRLPRISCRGPSGRRLPAPLAVVRPCRESKARTYRRERCAQFLQSCGLQRVRGAFYDQCRRSRLRFWCWKK